MSSSAVAQLRTGLWTRLRRARATVRSIRSPATIHDAVPYAVQRVRAHYPMLPVEEIVERLRYSTFVNFERRYMFFEVPKAGCTSLKIFLHRLEGLPPLKPLGRFDFPLRKNGAFHDRRLFQMHSLLDHSDADQELILGSPDFFRFALVRNPYMRLISAWKDKVQKCQPQFAYLYERLRGKLPEGLNDVIPFDEFLGFVETEDLDRTDGHWRRQTAHLFMPTMNFTCIGRMEQMPEAMQRFGQHLGQDIGLPIRSHPTFGSVKYDPQIRDRIYQLYEPDFVNFGYDKESWQDSDESLSNTVPLHGYLQEIINANAQIIKLDRIRRELLAMTKPG